jgi:hypothetical protein
METSASSGPTKLLFYRKFRDGARIKLCKLVLGLQNCNNTLLPQPVNAALLDACGIRQCSVAANAWYMLFSNMLENSNLTIEYLFI